MTLPVSDVINVSISMATINSKASISPDGGDGAIVVGVSLHQIIKQIFANNEQGFAYDPNDLSTMFQDAAGTVPVTAVGQPVGLMLDKSKGLVLGSEVVANGGFDTNTNWVLTSGLSISGGKLNIVASVGGAATQILGSYKPSGWYEIRLKVDTVTSSDFTVRLLSTSSIVGSGAYKNTAGEHIWKVLATAPFDRVAIQCGGGAGLTATIDSISVKELAGNHAYQTQSAMRPLLVASPQRLDFDTADDKLITSLPAQLTGCTVVRSVPNVGTQILTGQTIPATYEDNKDHCGLIVINRALTPSETSAIAAEFNKRAGV